MLLKTRMIPLFSATKTRPSAANSTAVGCVSPVRTWVSTNPGCSGPARTGSEAAAGMTRLPRTTAVSRVRAARVRDSSGTLDPRDGSGSPLARHDSGDRCCKPCVSAAVSSPYDRSHPPSRSRCSEARPCRGQRRGTVVRTRTTSEVFGRVGYCCGAMVTSAPTTKTGRRRCLDCGRFIGPGASLCREHAELRLSSSVLRPTAATSVSRRPTKGRPPSSEPRPADSRRRKCERCGRFLAASSQAQFCAHCLAGGSVVAALDQRADPSPRRPGSVTSLSGTIPIAPVSVVYAGTPLSPQPVSQVALRTQLSPDDVALRLQRSRTEFVVPRPSELHPALQPDSGGRAGPVLTHLGPRPGRDRTPRWTLRHRFRRWQRLFRTKSRRYRLPILVAALAGAIGILVALASTPPS